MYKLEIGMCLHYVSVSSGVDLFVPKLKSMLKPTVSIWWLHHVLINVFHQNQLQFSASLPPADD